MSVEKHYAESCYEQDTKDRAALKRRTNRQLTREQRRRQTRQTMALIGAVCMILASLITLLAALTVPAYADSQPQETAVTKADRGQPVALLEPEEPEEPEDYENEKIEAALLARAVRIDDLTVTHYDCCEACCGKADGITATGVRATPSVTVAVDPDVIPLGSDVLVDYGDGEIHYMRADDVGGDIKGHHIDICVKSHETAIKEGIKTATVYWISSETFN